MLNDLYPLMMVSQPHPNIIFYKLTKLHINELAEQWNLSTEMLQRAVEAAVPRYRAEGEVYLRKLRVLSELLVRIGNEVTQVRMHDLVRRYPDRRKVFVLAGSLHLPAFQNSIRFRDRWIEREQRALTQRGILK